MSENKKQKDEHFMVELEDGDAFLKAMTENLKGRTQADADRMEKTWKRMLGNDPTCN